MKKLILACLLFVLTGKDIHAQGSKLKKDESRGLYISGGSHAGLWLLLMGSNELPYTITIDKSIGADNTIGIGYSHDTYSKNPIYANKWIPTVRENIRFRYCHYFENMNERFAPYYGITAGIARWNIDERYSKETKASYFPTAQFIAGYKVNITNYFFNQTDVAIGPPYAVSTSFGIKF